MDANYATINLLNTNIANINTALIDKANVSDLNATNANITDLQATKADITELNAANANIDTLTGNLADITTLVNGNLTSDNIQSMVITGDKFTVANGFIKNAMIDSVSANKINTGTINTNNVKIQSADGSMVINGTTQQFKDKNNKVRIQIGKDAQGNFTFALFSQDGVGVLIDETGIKSGAVPNGLIVNDMVSNSANISGSKLDINSVISSINNGTTVIKGTRIQLDEQGQSLQVAFSRLKSKVETIENISIEGDLSSVIEQVTSNTTSINTMQGQISSLISNTTITKANGEVVQLKDEYNSTKSTVNSHSTKIGSLETNLSTANNNISSVSSKQTALEQNLDGFKQTVSNTYTTKADFDNLEIGGTNLVLNSSFVNGANNWNINEVSWSDITIIDEAMSPTGKAIKVTVNDIYGGHGIWQHVRPRKTGNYTLSFYAKADTDNYNIYAGQEGSVTKDFVLTTNWTKYTYTYNKDNLNTNAIVFYTRENASNGAFYIHSIKLEYGNKATDWTPAPEDIDSAISTVDGKFVNYSTTSQMNSAINQKANEITSTVSETYATKTIVTDLSNNLKNNYSTTTAMNSAINQKANEITSSVSETYTTKAEFNNLDIGGRNLVKNSNFAKGSSYWPLNWATSISDTILHNGHKSLRISASGQENYGWFGCTQTVLTDIKPNTTITVSCWYYVEDKSTFDDSFGLELKGKIGELDRVFIGVGTYSSQMENGVWKKIVATSTTDCHWDSLYIYPWVAKNGTVYVTDIKVELGNKATDWTPAPEDIDDSITAVDNKFVNYSTTSQMNSAINQKANEITSTVSETYATKTALNTVDGKFANYSTTTAMNTAINQKADSITQSVSNTYATKSSLKTATDNITSLTNRMSSAESKLTKDSLTTTIGKYYTTSTDVNGLITNKGYATTSQVSQTATDLTAKFTSSGGYNLLRNSAFTRDGSYWDLRGSTIDTSRTFNGHNSIKITSSGATSDVWKGIQQRFAENIPKGKTYTASLWYYVADKSTFNSNFALELKGKKTGATSEQPLKVTSVATSNLVQGAWTRLTVTATTSEAWQYLYIYPWVQKNGTIWITELQVEEGSLATLWTPHPYEAYDGITQISKDGVKVFHNSIDSNSYTHMSPAGFYIKNKGVDIFKVDTNGLYVKGEITSTSGDIGGYTINNHALVGTNVGMSSLSGGYGHAFWAGANGAANSGSAPFRVGHDGKLWATNAEIKGKVEITSGSMPSSLLTGTIDNARLNSTIVNGAANGSSAKSTLDSKANGWDSAKSTVDNNKTNWSNAYNRVVQWASGAVTGSTTINGGLIQTGTITAKQLYLGDLTNYCNLREETASLYGFTAEKIDDWGTWYKLNNNQRDICISGNKVNDYGYYKCMGGESFRIKFEVKSNVKGSSEGSDSVYCGVNVGLYGKLGDGSNFYQVPSSGYVGNANSTEGHINVCTTLPANARTFGVFLQLSGWGNWSGTCYIKNVQVFRMSSGELIVDGSVTADKIAANAITGKTITGGTINGSIFKSGTNYDPNKQNITGLQMLDDTIYSYGTKNNGMYAVTKISGGTINIGNGADGAGLNWSAHVTSSDISLFKQGSSGYFYVGTTNAPGSGYSTTTTTIDTTTINIGSQGETTAFKVDYNGNCEFGNNYFTRGSLTINQLSQGAAKGTQTYLSGTTISATNIYQNGSSVSGSDIILKDNIKEYEDSALDIINKTKVYSFNRILANPDKTEIGFLAQQVPDIFVFDKGEFTAEELEGLTAQEKQQLLDKKTKEHRTVLENKKLDEIADKVASFYDLNDEQTEAQISQIMDEYKNIEYEVPISTINQNNIIAIMFKAIQELKAE